MCLITPLALWVYSKTHRTPEPPKAPEVVRQIPLDDFDQVKPAIVVSPVIPVPHKATIKHVVKRKAPVVPPKVLPPVYVEPAEKPLVGSCSLGFFSYHCVFSAQ